MMSTFKKNVLQDIKDIKEDASRGWEDVMGAWKSQFTGSNESKSIHHQIRQYEKNIEQQEKCPGTLNEAINGLLPSTKAVIEYYEARPALAKYTITKELGRIKYTVFTHDDRILTDPTDITLYYKEHHQQSENNNDDLLWRCSNQSLLADVIAALTSIEGLIRPQLYAAVAVDYISIVMNFKTKRIHAECFLKVSIPCNGGEEDDRISLAGALVTVKFCPNENEFSANVDRIITCDELTSTEVDNATKAILELSII